MAKLDHKLTALATLSPAQLRVEWRDVFMEPAPPVPASLMRYALAYHLQELVDGGLPAATRRMLACSGSPAVSMAPAIKLKSGTRLLREWNGIVHAVLVTDDGLVFQERRFSSLSQIAKEITGAHWSGPRFFGLKRPVNPPRQGAATHG